MNRCCCYLFYFVFVSFSAFCQTVDIPRTYIAYKISEPVIIDGKQDSQWTKAPWSEEFVDIEGLKIPKYQTRVKMLWDDDYLYFYAELEEPHLWGDIVERDAVIFYNNDFEIFIDPDGDTHNYMEFEMNVLNTVWDLFLTRPYRNDPRVIDSWDILGLKTAVNVSGTVNDPTDRDLGWSAEVAMPWNVLLENAKRGLPENRYWRINFSRVDWNFELINNKYSRKKDAEGKYLPEYNWVWSPQKVINMHEPERWGYVHFASDPVPEFKLPPDEPIKLELYRIYREIKKSVDSQIKTSPKPILVAGKELPVKLENHQTGWNLIVKSPYTYELLIIKEDGEFVSIPTK